TSGSTTSGFTDSPYALLSLVNQASIEAIGRICGAQIDPARFRANIMIEGAEASAEYSWIGARVRIGEAIGRVVAPIERCAATNVNPADGQVDLNIPLVLRRHFGSIKMGVFIQIDHPGLVKLTDRLILCQ
ncbi:MAG: MOSC domain-containing protein, partial [Pseudomonadota bacterium]